VTTSTWSPALPALARQGQVQSLATLSRHGKSFSLAGKLLPEPVRLDAAALYAWCRRADDAVDLAAPGTAGAALAGVERELERVYAGSVEGDAELAAFQTVVARREIPELYPRELLSGMRMDVEGRSYRSLEELLFYCYRAAGVVGLMMCHVLGVRDERALRHAAHLGIAMQLTNIVRDVLEDWGRGRVYLPLDLLARAGAPSLEGAIGGDLPASARRPMAEVRRELLRVADRFYASGDAGLRYLDSRSALAIRAARLLYAEIGREVARSNHDVLAGRAVVSSLRKLGLLVRAGVQHTLELPSRWGRPSQDVPLRLQVRFPDDVLPV
jgi:phytoene synthase